MTGKALLQSWRYGARCIFLHVALTTIVSIAAISPAWGAPENWEQEWPRTDFSRAAVPLHEIQSGGPPKDGIPAIDNPVFVKVADAGNLSLRDPVIGVTINGESRAYPLKILIWHEIVNDRLGGVPIAVTYCPLCNASIVFERRLEDRVFDFGTTGKLRRSDLVMYDRQTESWWQQFTGEAIVGQMVGKELRTIPSRLESFAQFRSRVSDGEVLVPSDPNFRPYGRNPYVGYDSSAAPAFYSGPLHGKVPAMTYVVAVGDEAWTLALLRQRGSIRSGGLELTWTEGTASALDAPAIAAGRDIGNVVVRHRNGEEDVVYDLTFAFVFYAFRRDGVLHTLDGPVPWSETDSRR